MKKLKIVSVLFILLFGGCQKDITIEKDLEYPTRNHYDVYYSSGQLDSIIERQGLISRTSKVQRYDNFYDVTHAFKSPFAESNEIRRYVLQNNKVMEVLIKQKNDSSFKIMNKYTYQNGNIDSIFLYNHVSTGGSSITQKYHYTYSLIDSCVYRTREYVGTNPNQSGSISTSCYGKHFPYYLPSNWFSFSNPPQEHRFLMSSTTNESRNGIYNFKSSTDFKYDFDEGSSRLLIKNIHKSHYYTESNETVTSFQTVVQYHGI